MMFVAKMSKYGIFVAKFCKYALIDSFQGYAAVIDSSANCAALKKACVVTTLNPEIFKIFPGRVRVVKIKSG